MPRSPLLLASIAGALFLTISSGVKLIAAESSDERAVRAVAQAYFDGRARRDTVLLGSAFLLPQARMFAWRDTTLLELPIPEWLVRIANAPNTPRDSNDRDRIVSVDIDHTVAHLKLQTVTSRATITDHMNLVKVNGRWVVVSKIFEAVPR